MAQRAETLKNRSPCPRDDSGPTHARWPGEAAHRFGLVSGEPVSGRALWTESPLLPNKPLQRTARVNRFRAAAERHGVTNQFTSILTHDRPCTMIGA